MLELGYTAVGFTVFGALLVLALLRRREQAEPPEPSPPAAPPGPSLEQLAADVEGSPSFHNRVRMGWALLQAAQPERAVGYFEQALATHRGDKHALYGLGISQLERGAASDAARTLAGLVERSFAYEDYEAALALAEAHARCERNELAAELLAQVAEESGRLEHRLALARLHIRLAQNTEAQDVLRSALRQFDGQPALTRQRNGAAATEARRLLRTLEE